MRTSLKRRLSISEQIFGQMMEKAISSVHSVKHESANDPSVKLTCKEQERIAMGAELLQDFYDIKDLFAEIDSISMRAYNPGEVVNANINEISHVERITEAFYNYMKHAKKRQKTGFISNKFSKKQVVNQMRGEIQKVKARKLIHAQSTKFLMRATHSS